ncbi:flavoprotein [Enhygromyxa salina]|uniref:Coenzyme A biosynthesis bifunctional protein CoaBC n=1 Tax=Enhygromyxa salina TaxID=215803 RepID=A0A2S9YVK3_9BACT|nr:flavoprotein [Enhygromyxa salina]PRQ09079.1 Coenzyme A biosynthesis bifunctional protein CoaBC [Enhygromyxa salina]
MTNHDSSPTRLRRAPVVQIYDVRDTMVILAPDGEVRELSGLSAELARAVLQCCLTPCTRAQIVTRLELLTGGPIEEQELGVIDQLLAVLVAAKVLVPTSEQPAPAPSRPRTRLVLCLSGAIACSLAPGLIQRLLERGFEVRVVATEAALRFVQPEALEALVHFPVLSSLWPEDSGLPVPHINLAQWADAVLVWPATATTISRLATGYHSTLVSAIALCTRAPVVLVPSMNADMYSEPAVARNLQQLAADGMHVVHPGSGTELAHAPDTRLATLGPTPPHAVVVALLETALRIERARRADGQPATPRDADEWDRLFRTHQDHELGWHRDALDADMLAVLERAASPGTSVLDIGTGLGVAAIAAARLGCRVVATDIADTALLRARDRAGDSTGDTGIVWLRDDIADTRLYGTFDLLIDRGCLHLLSPEQLQPYAKAVARLTAPGGALLVKTHALSEGRSRGTTPWDRGMIEDLLGAAFTLETDEGSTLPGPAVTTAARLFVLRRRDPA